MKKLVLLRHGQSQWNKENRFTGWIDVPLSDEGIGEAKEAARLLREGGYAFDVAYTSVLKRAIKTLWTVLETNDQMWIPVVRTWRRGERAQMYWRCSRASTRARRSAKHGEAQVKIWRRSYDTPPPALEETDDRWPGRDARYAKLPKNEVPKTECLKDTVGRFPPLLGERHRARHPPRRAGHHRGPRKQPACAREAPRQRERRRHRRAEHPHGHPARVRARRSVEADEELLPGRSRGGQAGCRRRGGADQGLTRPPLTTTRRSRASPLPRTSRVRSSRR